MNAEIWVAIIGVIEAVIVVLLPTIVDKISKRNERKNDRKKFLPYFVKQSDDSEIETDINQILDQTVDVAKSSCYTSVYLREYKVYLELYIDRDKITVKTEYTLCFVNPYGIDYTYKRKPMLRKGLQYESYRWTKVIYQGMPCDEYVHEYPPHQQRTPDERYAFKTGLEVPIVKNYPESVLRYASEYTAESVNFLYTYRFWHHCKMMNIDVRLTGPDAKKHEIQWEVFLSTNPKSTQCVRSIHSNESDHVSLSASNWLLPGDGYVITINEAIK